MPYSSNAFDNLLKEHITKLNPQTILDVGAGAGKNGKLVRDTGYTHTLDCIEPTEGYITEYNLNTIYNTIYPTTLEDFISTKYKFQYDVVIFGDVLEHMFRSKVIDYLDYFLYKSKWIIIIWPNNMPQDDWGGNPYEIHKSNFKISDITEKFDVHFYLKNFAYYNHGNSTFSDAYMNYSVLRGYLTPTYESLYNLEMWK